jgi:hypothetical protein
MGKLDTDGARSTSTNDEEYNGQDEEDNTGIERFDESHGKLLKNK